MFSVVPKSPNILLIVDPLVHFLEFIFFNENIEGYNYFLLIFNLFHPITRSQIKILLK